MKSSILPSRILVLLAASCLVWVAILSLAFMSLAGRNVTAGWICAGALFFAILVWTLVMAAEFRSAVETVPCVDDQDFYELNPPTSPLPGASLREASRRGFRSVRRFLPAQTRPMPRRRARAERPEIR